MWKGTAASTYPEVALDNLAVLARIHGTNAVPLLPGGLAPQAWISFEVEGGQIVGLLGPNGAGKTTSFYMVVGLIPADEGTVTVDGKDITEWPMHQRAKFGIGYLPQEASVFRRMTVEEKLEDALQKITSMESELNRALKKAQGLEKKVEQLSAVNENLKSRFSKITQLNEGLEAKVSELLKFSATEPVSATMGEL